MLELKFNKENITKAELNQIEKCFKQFLKEKFTPEFNVLNLCRTDVYAHVLSIFIRLNVHQVLSMNISQVLDFLIDVAEKYTEAPYHTFYHAVDIVTMLYYLCHDLGADKYLTDLDITFLMVAALCHDIGHPGFNNAFQTNSKTDLALRYGGKSVLETYSVDLTIKLLAKHQIKHEKLNQTITDLILSTDMAYHGELEQQAKQLFTTWKQEKVTTHSDQDRISLCRILLHSADISNMARPWIISKQWSDLIIQEFFNQGDEEKKRNMTISPGMDREVCSQKNISLKFGEIILPFFQSLVSLLPKSHVLVDFLASNRIQWECLELVNNKKRQIRRVSSDIIIPPTTNNKRITTYKRIRLGFRSQSYPTVLYQHHENRLCVTSNCNNNNSNNDIIEKHNNLLPLVNFKSPLLYDNSNTIESIVLIHPYDHQ